MAFITASDIRTENAFVQRTVAWFDTAREAYAKNRMYRRTVNELNALSGRELADLGLHRSTIRAAAYESVYAN